MQTTLVNTWMKPMRFFAAGTSAVLMAAFALCLSPAAASAQQPIVTSQQNILGFFPSGGGQGYSQSPLSGTFVVTPNGNVVVGTEGGKDFMIYPINGSAATVANIGSPYILATLSGWNPGASAIDSYGNVYLTAIGYDKNIYKIPYNAATGTYAGLSPATQGFSTQPSTMCSGGTADTAPCIFASGFQSTFTTQSGYASLVFDAAGNLFIATSDVAAPANSIYECPKASLPACNSPTAIYADSNPIGALGVDPWDNLFFSDGSNSSPGGVTNLQEVKAGSSTVTTLESYTNKAGYGNGFSGVAVTADGTILFATNADGIYAIPNKKTTGPNLAGTFAVTQGGGYQVSADIHGNAYLVGYNSSNPAGDATYVVYQFQINKASLGATTVGGTANTAAVNILDSNGSCPASVTVTPEEFGATTSEFSATAPSGCSAVLGTSNGTFSPALALAGTGAATSTTISFSAAAVGERNAALVMTDTNNANNAAALSGVGQGVIGTVDPGVFTAFTKGLTTPSSVVADAAGDVFVADAGAGKVLEFPSGSTSSTTPTAVGSGFVQPSALAFDANGDLFVLDLNSGSPEVVEILNTGTSGAFVAGAQGNLLKPATTINGLALSSPAALAVGPDGSVYISDSGNSRVVTISPLTDEGGVTLGQATIEGLTSPSGLQNPQGIAVDSSGNLYIADEAQNLIFTVWNTGVVTTLTPPASVTAVSGVAVDASGSLIISDSASDGANGSNIVRIPNWNSQNNTAGLTTSQAIVIEAVSPTASSLWMDWAGDLYVASVSGASANVIMRSQTAGASINIGSVADGASNTGTVYLENAGNETAALANTDTSEPTNTMFTLEPGTTNGCQGGGNGGPAGAWCTFTAEFAPPAGTTAGNYSGTAGIVLTTPAVTIPVVISGSATASAALPNTITWSPSTPTTGEVGQVISLSATSTSTEPVSFASTTSSTCSVSGSIGSGFTATFTGAGACKIQATVPACSPNGCSVGGNLYAAATPVTQTITLSTLTPAAEPTLLMIQNNATFPGILGGGVLAGPISGGTSIGVGNNGYVAVSETYGGDVDIYNLAAGTVAHLGAFSNPGGVTADSQGNLYVAGQYNNLIAKVPYSGGAYAALSSPSGSTASCTATSTTECVLGPIKGVSSIGGIGAMTFDSNGDIFIAQDPQGSTPFSIWECTAACLSTGTPAPVMVFQEPTGTGNNQLYIGALGVDPWGNLFFTDTMFYNQAANSGNNAQYSDVYELPTSTGAGFGGATTGYAATPTLLQTFCDNTYTGSTCNLVASPGGYDNNLDALTVAPNGTVYYATLYNGVNAIPNTKTGGPVVADQYPVSGTGAKVMGVDANGNVYEVTSALNVLSIGDLTVPTAQYLGTPTTASASVVVNGIGYCPATGPNLSFAFSGTDAADFSATAGSTCSGLAIGNGFLNQAFASSYPATITFTPNDPGSQTVTATASDTNYGGVGTATVTGLAQTTPETISFSSPANNTSYTYAAPPSPTTVALTVANGPSNFAVTFSVDASSTGAGTFSSTTVSGTNSTATLTVTQAGTIVIDAVEPAGLASNHIYYSQSNQAQLTLVINQASQTITFTPIAQSTYTYAAAPNQITIPLSATGGASGNTVEFSVDASSTGTATITPSTMVGSASLATLTVTGAGSIIIDASQAATTDYAAASLQNAQTLTINQAAQTITFVAPTQAVHFIVGGITVPVSALGGGSDNAITFTVDTVNSTMMATIGSSTVSGATSTATLTIPAQGNVVSGKIVLDATQSQSANYAATSATPLVTLVIMAPLPTQTITFNNPGTQVVGTSVTLGATASSTLPVSYSSSTASVCTLVGSVVSFNANLTTVSTCTIVATQPGDNTNWAAAAPVTQSFTVNPTGQNPGITVGLSLSALTIEPGTSGLTQLTVTSLNNFTGSLAVTCSGLPTGYTCTANPNPATIAEGGTATSTITVTPPSTSAMVRHDSRLAPLAALAFALGFLGFRKRTRLQLLVVLALGLTAFGALSACGGSASTSTTGATISNATIKVTSSGMGGASSSVQESATLSVTVE